MPKSVNEDQLRKVFEKYGNIVELSILRGSDGASKGCAFLKYEHRQEAINAINACHGQVYMQVRASETETARNSLLIPFLCMKGGTQSLVVKFADMPKKKETSKQQHQQQDDLALKNQQLQLLLQQMASMYQFPQYSSLGVSLPGSSTGLGVSPVLLLFIENNSFLL